MLGVIIKKYMTEKGIKQTFLAEKMGVSSQVINAILNENRKIEAYEYFEICKALDRPLDYFFSQNKKQTNVR